MLFRKKKDRLGQYPSCNMLNNALRYLFQGDVTSNMSAIEEIMYAILKADGFFYESNFDNLVRYGKLSEEYRERLVFKNNIK